MVLPGHFSSQQVIEHGWVNRPFEPASNGKALGPAHSCGLRLKAGERQRLQAIDSYLQTHLAEPINTSDMARALGLSATSLQRLIRQAHGCSLAHHIRAHKLDRARMALERDGISVAEAAYMVGYNSPANFATAFRRAFGLPPSAVQDR